MAIEFQKHEKITLREVGLDEKWLQEQITKDPSILGLGDLTLLSKEHKQSSGGLSVATIGYREVLEVLGHVKRADLGADVVASPGTRGARGVFRQARDGMKGAHRHHGRHVGCSPRPAGGSVAFSLSRRFPCVPMVETADARQRNQIRPRRPRLNCPARRRVLAKPIVGTVRVVVAHVLAGQAPHVRFVQRDHVIEAIPARAAHPALRDRVSPRRLDRRLDDPRRSQ